ncbi:HupE/UreJ family protein [Andreprevotia chitinilytica]|uniref:HupE/UreJ family protein n=1 Tax=Andreprevotia chitinilytica TaxID=396808 RepID=UPI00068D5E16|nr:HupE/UreJ family protein [Andreprevotia chitinilytica]
MIDILSAAAAVAADPFTTLQAAPAHMDLWQTFTTYTDHGIWHILTGYDHLLFVTALVLAARNFWDLIKVVSAFTLAHTLTLTLSVLHVVHLSPQIVEPMISASIVAVALDNILRPQQRAGVQRLALAFAFGLFHGLGFAGGLTDAMAGLPTVGLGTALASFSLGVEIGHQLVVIPVYLLLRYGRQRWEERFNHTTRRYGSAAISVAGSYFLVNALGWVG